MIARIIPLTRLPAGMHVFDYTIPPTLVENILPGQIVSIPFRKTKRFGLVLSIQTSPENTDKLKPITDIITPHAIVTEEQMEFIIFLAKFYGVSAGIIARQSLPPIKPTKLKKEEAIPSSHSDTHQTSQPSTYRKYDDESTQTAIYQELLKKTRKCLVLVPRHQFLSAVQNIISTLSDSPIILWHSELTDREKYDAWFTIMRSTRCTIIGTRGTALLPIDDLSTIIIDYEYDDEHKHSDMSPRFHTKDVAMMRHRAFGTDVVHIGMMPSIDSYFLTDAESREKLFDNDPDSPFAIVDMVEEYRARRFNVLSDTVKTAIKSASGDVLILVSRRGFSRSLSCRSCGYVHLCETCRSAKVYHKDIDRLVCHYCHKSEPVIHTCPKCRDAIMEFGGYGSAFIAEGVGELLRDTDWIVTRVDSDTGVTDLDPKKKNIVIGTELALRSVLWDNISLVIHVDPDKSLQTPEMNADERLWHTLWSIVHRTHLWTKILLQTFSREHILYRSLQTPELFYRTTLEARHALDFPPYSYLVRYIYADDTPQKAQSISEKMYTHLTRETEAMGIVCKISTPAPTHPAYHRRKYCFVIIIRFDITTKLNTIAKLNSYFGHGWKIDPRPNTLQMI